jgi:riboflavin kinase / FMN adenylyltransferase
MKLCGTVISGDGRGRGLGFPTANLDIQKGVDIPAPGVYAGQAIVGETPYKAAIHIGPRPTFADATSTVEAHILDFSADIYNQTICLVIIHKLRDIEKFDTIEALQTAIEADCRTTRSMIEL